MLRRFFFAYGLIAHLLFFAVYAYLAGFVGNLLVPKTIDSSPSANTLAAIGVDLLLLTLFAVPHSVMARPSFKRVWTRIIPQPIERSTYVLIANGFVCLLVWQWRAIDNVIWNVQHPASRAICWALFACGWLLVPAVSFMINHFDLFGTRQVWLNLKGRPNQPMPFRTPMLYAKIRHPLYVGWFIAFWATPTMTLGHLLFAVTMTLYMVIAVYFEERNLVEHFGHEYRDYQRRVPKYIPRLGGSAPTQPVPEATPDAIFTKTEVG